jgi:F0F1-type ATP synthase membrane subunit c/vacuolar-type H+-ATPase subunit K/plasmid stabilization system protein ParE
MTLAAWRLGRLVLGAAIALALTLAPAAAHQGQLCTRAIRAAERSFDLPAGLLMAVALTETGRRVGDVLTPWAWSINAAGEGAWLEHRRAALERARALQASGVESIDVGCMQVNLKWHAAAFDSLESAFDPRTNVTYAARHLKELRARSRDWLEAAGHYHSADPAQARRYLARLNRNWSAVLAGPEGGRMLLPPAPGQIALGFGWAPAGGIGPLVDIMATGRTAPLLDAHGRSLPALVPAQGVRAAGP